VNVKKPSALIDLLSASLENLQEHGTARVLPWSCGKPAGSRLLEPDV